MLVEKSKVVLPDSVESEGLGEEGSDLAEPKVDLTSFVKTPTLCGRHILFKQENSFNSAL
jgi:hypothetical protein